MQAYGNPTQARRCSPKWNWPPLRNASDSDTEKYTTLDSKWTVKANADHPSRPFTFYIPEFLSDSEEAEQHRLGDEWERREAAI